MKIQLLIPAFLLMAMTVSAQQEQASFGVRIGPGFTTLGGENADGSAFRVGYHLGGYFLQPINESISIESGLQFASKGAKDDSGIFGNTKVSVRNSYLDIPLLMRLQTGDFFNVFFGLQPSILLASAFVINEGGDRVTVNGSGVKDLWKDFDFAGVAGIGASLGSGFNLQLSYEHGFVNTSENSESIFNRGFKLSLGKSF